MARLKHSELEAFSNTLLELYSPGPQEDLPARILAALERNISCEHRCYHEFSDQIAMRVAHKPSVQIDINAFNQYADQHPALGAIIRDQIRSSARISDFKTLSQWRRTDLYNLCFRPEGLNYQLGYLALNEGPRLGIALNRAKRDFSEEERTLFDLLIPHLFQVFRTSQFLSRLSEVAEASGQAWIAADCSGRILFETGKAVHWLVEYFGHNGSLPAQIRDWLKRRASSLGDPSGVSLPLKDFSIQRGSKRLTVRSLSSVQAAEHRLVLTETSEELDANSLQTLGLTKREAEVLFWVSQGKRNCEIAEILGARSRTIGKHVERILGKLCVETRTAAANIAAEVLHLR